jgi:tRNA dimethylallyltransferase
VSQRPGLDTAVIGIVGPTAVGKSAVAEMIAARLDGQVISADSMQVYRGMHIGTSKTPTADRLVAHHCLDLVDPGEPYSAALYQRDARAVIDRLLLEGVTPVLAGGTGLYVRAALDDMCFPEGALEGPGRHSLEVDAERLGAQELHDRLAEIDPASAAAIHPNNVRRVIRALEMAEQGLSYAEQAAGFSDRNAIYPTTLIGLTMERSALYERIDSRVDAMIASGLLAEVEGLLEAGYREALTAAQAIGYKELLPVLEDEADLGEALEAIKRASRRYAKRQLTWFRADPRIKWLDVTGLTPSDATARVADLVESQSRLDEPRGG